MNDDTRPQRQMFDESHRRISDALAKGATMNVYEKLVQIADSDPKLLVSYSQDLTVHDKHAIGLMKSFTQFIWCCRENGTELFQLGIGREPIWLTFWLNGPGKLGTERTFLVNMTTNGTGEVEEIPHEDAIRLANQQTTNG